MEDLRQGLCPLCKGTQIGATVVQTALPIGLRIDGITPLSDEPTEEPFLMETRIFCFHCGFNQSFFSPEGEGSISELRQKFPRCMKVLGPNHDPNSLL